ncbi:hypothetical protein BDZ45DRAFT_62336 [Acephala macrosclerotiorum]|nr:hypothetical protein BDZ45DRAFT_62336 [Acephala macrosclerotiorum]
MAPMIVEHDYYEVLGVSNTASLDVVRQNFRRLALERHPDKNKNEPDATAAFQLLAEAFQTIKDPEQRRQYDKIWPIIRDKARREKQPTQRREETADHGTETSAAHREKAAKVREEHLKREREQRYKEQEAEKVRKAAEELQRQKIEKEMADRVREQIRAAREAEKHRTKDEQGESRKAAEAEENKLRDLRKVAENIRKEEEAHMRRMQSREEERQKAAEANSAALKEEARRAQIQQLESQRAAYKRNLFEAEDRLDELSVEIQWLQELDDEDDKWKEKKSGMAHVISAMDPSARAKHKRELQNREARRLERDATRRIRTVQLEKQEIEVQQAFDRLADVKAKIAAAKDLQEEATQKREDVRKERTPYKDQAEKGSDSEKPNKTSAREDDFFGSAKQRRPSESPQFPFEQAKKKAPAREAQTSSPPPQHPSFAKSRRQSTDHTKDTWSSPSGQPKRDPPPRRATFASEPKASSRYTDRARSPARGKGASAQYFSKDEPPSPPPRQSAKKSFAREPHSETRRERSPEPYQSRRDSDLPRRAEPKKASSQYFARARSPSPPLPPAPRSFSYQDAPREEIRRQRSPRRPVRADALPRRATYDSEPRKASSQYSDDRESSSRPHYFARERSPSPTRVRPSPPPMPRDDIPSARDRDSPRERREEYPASSRTFEKRDRRDGRSYDRDDSYDSRHNSYEDDALDIDDIQLLIDGFGELLRRQRRRRAAERGQR